MTVVQPVTSPTSPVSFGSSSSVAVADLTLLPDGSGQRLWTDGTEEVWDALGNHMIDYADGRSETRDPFGNRCILHPCGTIEHLHADGSWDWVDSMGRSEKRVSAAVEASPGWEEAGMIDLTAYRNAGLGQTPLVPERPPEAVLEDVLSILRS